MSLPQLPVPGVTRLLAALPRSVAVVALVFAAATASVAPAAAATSAAGDITLEPRALLGGHVRAGSWAGVVVTVRNTGPAVTGELRLSSGAEARTAYGTLVDLPTGSVKEYVLYAQPAIFRTTLDVTLLSDGATLASTTVPITSHDPYTPIVGVIAERPQGIVADLTDAARPSSSPNTAIVPLSPADLPGRVEGWSALDRLVWQDVDAGQLDADQLAALTTWLGAGGRLVILGGTTGTTTLAGFPDDILPFQPSATIDVPALDLANLIGSPPDDAEPVPALSGELARGVALARSDGRVVAAETRIGQGSVTLVGFDPATAWLRETPAALGLWRRLLPVGTSPDVNPLVVSDDSTIVSALTNNLPAAELPRLEQLFALLGGYIVLIGPINYLVLRRLDRREWAWLTMPLLVIVFSVGSWTLGRVLKGTDVIVNQVAIVRAASGTETGLAQVYVGVFSPTRREYDVGVTGNPLLSNPVSLQSQGGTFEQPLDVLQGETAQLRGYGVGFGAVRGFRAETAAPTPRVTHSLRYVEGRLQGEIRNDSDAVLEAAALVFGGAAARLGTIGPGESRQIDLRVAGPDEVSFGLPDRIFGSPTGQAGTYQRTFTRRAVIEQLFGYDGSRGGTSLGEATPLLVAWRPEAPLEVRLDVDPPPHVVGDTVYVMPLQAEFAGAAEFPDSLLRRTVLDSDAVESLATPDGFQLSRGTTTVEFRAPAFDGRFEADGLTIFLGQGGQLAVPAGAPVEPLPAAEQPDQEDPVGEGVEGFQPLPAFQLWDRTDRRWLEFPMPEPDANGGVGENHAIAEPERYVDESGAFLVRFVNRGESSFFSVLASLAGTIR